MPGLGPGNPRGSNRSFPPSDQRRELSIAMRVSVKTGAFDASRGRPCVACVYPETSDLGSRGRSHSPGSDGICHRFAGEIQEPARSADADRYRRALIASFDQAEDDDARALIVMPASTRMAISNATTSKPEATRNGAPGISHGALPPMK